PHLLHLRGGQHGHGERPAPRRRGAAAVHQLRWHLAHHAVPGYRHPDEHPLPPRPGADVKAPALLAAAALVCTGCATHGGYLKGDGPGGKPPVNLDKLADATPRSEPLNAGANTPYTA